MGVPITILGGGMASLVTAFELSRLTDPRYDITVYQQGWRLGGKGASSRNELEGERIEEHGLHVLFGCYENTFRILREIYRELPDAIADLRGRPEWSWLPDAWTFDQAFTGHDVVVMQELVGDQWTPWVADGRGVVQPGEPGVAADGESHELDPWRLVRQVTDWMVGWAAAVPGAAHDADAGGPPPIDADDAAARRFLEEVEGAVRDALHLLARNRDPAERMIAYLVRARTLVRYVVDGLLDGTSRVFDAFAGCLQVGWSWLRGPRRAFRALRTAARRALAAVDFGLTTILGLIDDRVLPGCTNWFAIDDYDLRDWLARKGALAVTLRSPIVQGLYAAVFSSDMRPTARRPSPDERLAAGTILHVLLRATHYKGHLFYRMHAGMGEAIFAPLYLVLLHRGVKFELFHRVTALRLAPDRAAVERIAFERQARTAGAGYVPLRRVTGRDGVELATWPRIPDARQLTLPQSQQSLPPGQLDDYWASLENWWADGRDGDADEIRLDAEGGSLVLGISVGAFPDVCRELIEDPDNPAFADMVGSVATTQTQAAQLWLNRSLSALGWPGAPGIQPIVIPFAAPFDTWADMTHLLDRENLAAADQLSYICAALWEEEPPPRVRTDGTYVQRQAARVQQHLGAWLNRAAPSLLPRVLDRGGRFDPRILTGTYHCAVANPSDRYVLAVPGSSAKRLRAHESGYANLYLAGDWTKTALSIGCLEAATMSGIAAARAIDGRVGRAAFDWLPDPRASEPNGVAAPIAVENRS